MVNIGISGVELEVITVISVCLIWFLARKAGFEGFDRMQNSIKLVNDSEQGAKRSRWKSLSSIVTLSLWAWIAVLICESFHQYILAEVIFSIGVFELLFYGVLAYSRRSSDGIVRRKVEDYVATVLVVLFLILSFIPQTSSLVNSAYITPIFLLAGIKSMYDAPEELAQNS